jgi:D-alanine-D-alanine ligase
MQQGTEHLGRIGVLMGGVSSEREISLKSGRAVSEALIRQGQDVVPLDITESDETKIDALIRKSRLDVAFIALHGRLGEDGTIQTILDKAQVPYTGSGAKASYLALNKAAAQDLFEKNGIRTPSHVILNGKDLSQLDEKIARAGSFPLVVKPACEGSSIGISIVPGNKELKSALEVAWRYGETVLIEKYIAGRELTVGIIGTEALPVVEICPLNKFFDFEAKYTAGKTEYIVPAKIPEKIAAEVRKTALKAHRLLGCENISRVDFMIDAHGRHFILEVNTIPGFTATSLLPKAAQQTGLGFDQLCLAIIQLAYGKKKEHKYSTLRH